LSERFFVLSGRRLSGTLRFFDNFGSTGILLGAFWHRVPAHWHHVGKSVDFRRFVGETRTPFWLHFAPAGVIFPFLGRRKLKICVFLGHSGERSDFDLNSGRILGCLGWLKRRFRV
jgi:hypothetical protein